MQKPVMHQQDSSLNKESGFNGRLSAIGRLRYCIWLSSMGFSLIAGGMPYAAQAAPVFGSAAWFAQAGAYKPAKPATNNGKPTTPANPVINTPQQARLNTQRSMNNLSQAVQAINSAQKAQSAAQQLSLGKPGTVPDGLGKGGLQVAEGVGQDPSLWQNAKGPTQTVKDGQTTVEIKQTAAKSILTWDTFNVGQKTTVHFDQTDGNLAKGGNEWVSLNRITDPAQKPSEILGKIKAEGSVYLLNPNGVIFGAGSTVNTHSLIVSSLDLFSSDVVESNKAFMEKGLLGVTTGQNLLVGEPTMEGDKLKARDAIRIEKGAQIKTGKNGFSLIAAPELVNNGAITAEDGQVILAGASKLTATGDALEIRQGILNPVVERGGDLVNNGIIQSVQGNVTLLGKNINQNGVVGSTTSLTRQGSIDIRAQESNGGSIKPSRVGYLEFGKDSVTTILLSDNGETTTSSESASSAVKPSSVNVAAGAIAFKEGSLLLAPGATLNLTAFYETPNSIYPEIPDRQFVVGRVFMDTKATINVAGMPNVFATEDTLLKIPRIGLNELANSPLLRDSFLYTSKDVVVDTSLQGTREDGTTWVGSPLLNIKGYKDQKARKIDELMVNGGVINIVGNEVLIKQNADINIDGGYVVYPGGKGSTTKLLTETGQLQDIGSADPNGIYTGIGGVFEVNHSRANLKEIYIDPLLSGQVASYRPAYIVGGNAGTLNIFARNTLFLDGNLYANAYAGLNQVLANNQPKGGTLSINDRYLLASRGILTDPFSVKENNIFSPSLVFRDKPLKLSREFEVNTSLDSLRQQSGAASSPDNLNFWSAIDTGLINGSGLGQLFAYANGGRILLTEGSKLEVAKGGKINFTAHQIQIDGSLQATAGQVNLLTRLYQDANQDLTQGGFLMPVDSNVDKGPKTDIVIGKNAIVDVSGDWVNDKGASSSLISGSQFIHGGKISMAIDSNSVQADRVSGELNAIDKTGSIYLKKGSLLDASSGGYVQANGQLQQKNGVPAGNGGEISLKVYNSDFQYSAIGKVFTQPGSKPTDGHIQLDGELRGYGFNHGAKLTLQALNIVIGEQPDTSKGTLNLKPDLFTEQGFGSYELNALYDNKITKNTIIQLTQKNWIAQLDDLLQAPTGTKLNSPDLVRLGQLDDYHRSATDLSLSAGKYHFWGYNSGGLDDLKATPAYDVAAKGSVLLEKGTVIKADAQASISLKAVNQVRVDGKISTPGGNITLNGDQGALGFTAGNSASVNYIGADKGIWLGAHSVLDVSGTSLLNPLAKPVLLDGSLAQPKTGKLVDGGTITISNDGGFIAALQGAQINIAGAEDTFDLMQVTDGRGTLLYGRQNVWSNAGTLNLAASTGLYFDASIKAQGGNTKAQGGSLNLRGVNGGLTGQLLNGDIYQGAKAIVLSQSGKALTGLAGIEKTGDIPDAARGILHFDVTRLKGSGIDSLSINADKQGLALASQSPAPVYFAGNVDISLARAFIANASYFTAIPALDNLNAEPQAVTAGYNSQPATKVNITAPYVQLAGLYNNNAGMRFEAIASRANSVLNVNAGHIDLLGTFGLANFATANLQSSGDIRFINQYKQGVNSKDRYAGVLYSSGDLNFNAAQLYPATATEFMVIANAQGIADAKGDTATSIRIGRAKGSQAKPVLSAGGSLKFDADTIDQAGVIKAPLGQIVLGVSQPLDQAVQAEWDNLPLTLTSLVNIQNNSVTSVSLEGQTVPYGETVDGKQWQFNDVAGEKARTVEALPGKRISLNAESVNTQKGAVIDLSGSGDVQASEWVAGTGGSRDVLSQFNTSYESGKSEQVALYSDQREVYAILPGFNSDVAVFDPTFSNDVTHNLGKQVYLSGIDGLPAGTYTLLPAKYATLPNAYRVVQRTQVVDSLVNQNTRLPDGTALVSGYFVDGLSGSQRARSTTFEVQSNKVWRQYSEYTLTSGNTFFSQAGLTPKDAGQLVLNANKKLQLGAQIKSQAEQNGIKAQVDISSQSIQIVSNLNSSNVDADKLTLAVDDINSLNAGSLLIGGVRETSKDGVYVQVTADEVSVANNAANPLVAPELILTAKASSPDQTSVGGVQVAAGSVIKAQGDLTGNTQTMIIGKDASADGTVEGIHGDGALLRVSNAGASNIIRRNLSNDGSLSGVLNIAANAVIDGGKSLTLNTSNNALIDDSVKISAKDIAVDSGKIAFGQAGEDFQGFTISNKALAQFENAEHIRLRSYNSIDFFGDVSITNAKQLTLSAASFNNNGGNVNINANQLTLSNELQAQPSDNSNSATGSLAVNTNKLIIGAGDKQTTGFSKINLSGKDLIALQGKGSLNTGTAALTLKAPVVRAEQGAQQQIKTTNQLQVQTSGEQSKAVKDAAAENLGGRLELVAASISSNGIIQAKAGQVSLTANKGDITLRDGSLIDVTGVKKAFYDTAAYAPGGRINLTADSGSINLQQKATLDFSAAAEGGNAGRLSLSAPSQAINLQGELKGQAAKGLGGEFLLDSGKAVNLNQLSDVLNASGVNQLISVRTHQSDLSLNSNKTLTANKVELIADADAGKVNIAGKIDASGTAGGEIRLSGRGGVNVDGQLIASGSDKNQRGGQVSLSTTAKSDGTLNEDYGYQNVDAKDAGKIRIGSTAVIDVSGGSAGGLSGGVVSIRTPLLKDGDVNVSVESGAQIKGAREVALEAYAVWSTTDEVIDPAKHFDGVIDPAGWYGQDGKLLAGTFTDDKGNFVALSGDLDEATTADYLRKYIFTPDFSNTDHQTFYGYVNGDATAALPGTLMGFVQNPKFNFAKRFAGITNLVLRPGIELQNPSKTINDGSIQIVTPWNLAAGRLNGNTPQLDYRFNGVAPVLSLRADGDIKMQASISDGFFQFSNPFGSSGGIGSSSYIDVQSYYDNNGLGSYREVYNWLENYNLLPAIDLPTNVDDNPNQEAVGQYYALYEEYLKMLTTTNDMIGADVYGYIYAFPLFNPHTLYDNQPSAPTPATTTAEYPQYLKEYNDYLTQINDFWNQSQTGEMPKVEPLLPPPTQLEVIPAEAAAVDNTPSPTMQAGNMLPLHTGELLNTDSSSYRLVAGASFNSANPNQLKAASAAASITLSGSQSATTNLSSADGVASADRTLALPTMLRTGVGSIDLNAVTDIRLDDAQVPAVIYTAGMPADAVTSSHKIDKNLLHRDGNPLSGILINAPVNPEAAGNVHLTAGRDIISSQQVTDTDGMQSSTPGMYLAQYWWDWMQTGNIIDSNNEVTRSSINFANFKQGIMSIGGQVNITAGRDIRELAVSLPTTWYVNDAGKYTTVGGGNLNVLAGNNILSGSYFVAKGTGNISALGEIAPAFNLENANRAYNGSGIYNSPVSTILALQDATLNVQGVSGVNIGGIFNPSMFGSDEILTVIKTLDSHQYSQQSAVNINSISQDVQLNTIKSPAEVLYGSILLSSPGIPTVDNRITWWLPASLNLVALKGNINIAGGGHMTASPTGNLNILADQSIKLSNPDNLNSASLRMGDVYLGEFFNPRVGDDAGNIVPPSNYDQFLTAMHKDDHTPARIYSLNGDIANGIQYADSSSLVNGLNITIPKVAQIYAGRDIVNLAFYGQNLHKSDITQIIAGRDIVNMAMIPVELTYDGKFYNNLSVLSLAGSGNFNIHAGRNIGPLTNANDALFGKDSGLENLSLGIIAVGNQSSDSFNPALPRESANINIHFGVANGIATQAFIDMYINPQAEAVSGLPKFNQELINFVSEFNAGQAFNTGYVKDQKQTGKQLTVAEAWKQFQALSTAAKQLFVDQVFNSILATTARDYNNPDSAHYQKYVRGYQAINTLYPAKNGYTQNNLLGGENGAASLKETGNLDIRATTVQTQQGGDINIYAPGGQLLIGGNNAAPLIYNRQGILIAGSSKQGILALEQGDINIFADQSVLLAQSRIFTQQGGNMLIWSSNSDINAGKGAKTTSELPPVNYLCTVDKYCYVDSKAQVSGAGIAALQTVSGGKPGDVYLVAPRGTVDAGDAGIRVAGTIYVAAQRVASADNFQVQGASVGVPTVAQVDTSALGAANSAVAAAVQQAMNMAKQQPAASKADTMITVDIVNIDGNKEY